MRMKRNDNSDLWGCRMEYTKIKNINEYVSESINPMKTPDTVFEMYSVPIYETGHPEYLRGSEIASNKTIVRKNDVLLCKINPRINRVWVVGDESQYQNIASSEWIVIRTSEYNPEFLAWYFRNPKFQKLMMSEVTGIGGSLTRAQPKAVAEYPVPVLPRLEQDAIAEVLNRVNDMINGRKQQLQKLDDLVKARFVELFGDMILNPNSWEKVDLGTVCDVRDGTHDSPKYFAEGIPLVTSRNLSSGRIDFTDCNLICEADYNKINERSKVDLGDILMPMIGTVGNPIIVDIDAEFAIKNVALIKFSENSKVVNVFVKALLESDYFDRAVLDKVRGGTQKFISLGDIRRLKVCLPPLEVQKQFAAFVTQADKSKAAVQKALDEAQLLFDSLMQKYFG